MRLEVGLSLTAAAVSEPVSVHWSISLWISDAVGSLRPAVPERSCALASQPGVGGIVQVRWFVEELLHTVTSPPPGFG